MTEEERKTDLEDHKMTWRAWAMGVEAAFMRKEMREAARREGLVQAVPNIPAVLVETRERRVGFARPSVQYAVPRE